MDIYAAVDVHYRRETATTALVEFSDFSSCSISRSLIQACDISAPYIPGKFYLRELPCILKILKKAKRHYKIIIIDGFVFLRKPMVFGLGGYLAKALNYQTAIIGVAKNHLNQAQGFVEVTRGSSSRPLFVSACNMEPETAGALIKHMYGRFRIPYILKITDKLSRNPTIDIKLKIN
jgi:deoxyribonuclease V